VDEAAASAGIDDLVQTVEEEVGVPMDALAVAAFLESKGLRDVDAIQDYERPHIFGLAADIYAMVLARAGAADDAPAPEALSRMAALRRFVVLYLRGLLFALPMAGQVFAVLVLRYNLWAWLDFSPMQASVVAIGTIGSFVITGGLVQAIGREGTFYASQKNWLLLDRVGRRLILIGTVLGAAGIVGSLAANVVLPLFTPTQLTIALLYFGLLTSLWLWFAMLYMLEAHAVTLGTTAVGVGVVHLVMQATGWGIHLAHAAGLLAANGAAAAYTVWAIRRKFGDMPDKYKLSRLPRPAVFVHIVKPFLAYGTLYFTFLFTDRMVGWTASDAPLPLFLWFRTSYELGMDWALIALVFTIAVLEYTIHEFGRVIIPYQQFFLGAAYEEHNRHFTTFYRRQRGMLLVACILAVGGVFVGGLWLSTFEQFRLVRDFFANDITWYTYFGASLGYSLLAFGLLDGLFFFSLARPWPVVRNMAAGLLVNVVVGYAASRLGPYWLSIFGLIAGAGTFAWRMSRDARKMFRTLDHAYYAAF